MIELIFLLGFSLHNIEEALWLPQWSKYAKKYHKVVSENEFRFAVIIITAVGYLITFQYFIFSSRFAISKYIFLGFILMMVINVLFPHLISTILLKKYAPGTITGVILNAPVGVYLLIHNISAINELYYVIMTGIIIAVVILGMINLLFKIGNRIFD